MAAIHGGAFWSAVEGDIDELKGIVRADVLDAWFPPAPGVLAALSKHLATICNTSPEVEGTALTKAIADWRGVPKECILVGAGASALIYSALPRWLQGCRCAAILDPTYSEYPFLLDKLNISICRVPSQLSPQFLEEAADSDAIVLVNPNNPTGTTIDTNTFVVSIPESTRLWVDETYLEYAEGETSVECFAAEKPNVVVCKSLSKTLALSGLHVGYLVAHPDTIRELKNIAPPYPVSLPAQVATLEAIKDPHYYRNRYSDTREARHDLAHSLQAQETKINCVLLQVAKPEETVMRLRDDGVYIRDLGNGTLRIAVRPRPEAWQLVRAFHKILS